MTTYSRAVIEGVERVYADVDGQPDYRLVDLATRGATIEPCEAPPRGIVHVLEHTEDGRVIVHGCEGGRPSEAIMSRAHRLETGVSAAAVRARAQVDAWRAEAEAGKLSVDDETIRETCELALGVDESTEPQALRSTDQRGRAERRRKARRELIQLENDAAQPGIDQEDADAILDSAIKTGKVIGLSESQIRNRLSQVTDLISSNARGRE